MHPSNVIVVAFMYGVVTIVWTNWAKCCGIPFKLLADALLSPMCPCAIAIDRRPRDANSAAHTFVIASMLPEAVSFAIWPNCG